MTTLIADVDRPRIMSRRQYLDELTRDPAGRYRAVGATYDVDDERLLEILEPVIQDIVAFRAIRARHPGAEADDVHFLLAMVESALDGVES